MNIKNISAGLDQRERFPWINAYMINGSALIDPGLGYDAGENINLNSIESIFLTFPHPEHYGILEDLEFGDVTVYLRDREEIDLDADYPIVEVSGGDTVWLGGKEFQVIERKGLMPSIGLYSQERHLLFSGHLFVENRGMLESTASQQSYIRLLEQLQELEIETIYPSHGDELPTDVIQSELGRVRSIEPDRFAFSEGMLEANSLARSYEHEWNRGFDNPYRKYPPNEKWMFYLVDPDHGALKALIGGLMMYLSAAYLILITKFRSEDYIENRYVK